MPPILLRRGNAANLTPGLLADGEPAFTLDTHQLYVGQGGTNWPIGGTTLTVTDTPTVDLTLAAGNLVADARYQMSLAADALGLKLQGDVATPGNTYYYGTDSAGTKGFFALRTSTDGLWRYSTTTTMADPGAGKLRGNNASGAAVTQIAISKLTDRNIDVTTLLRSLRAGDIVAIQDQSDATNYLRYSLGAAPTDNSTWWLLPVTYISGGGGGAANNAVFLVTFVYGGGAAGGVADGNKGDITVGSSGTNWQINAAAVGNAEFRDSAAASVVGKAGGIGSGPVADITAVSGGNGVLSELGGALAFRRIATANIDPDQVTYDRIQNVSASPRLLGRGSAGAGDVEEITAGTGLSFSGTTLNVTTSSAPVVPGTCHGRLTLASGVPVTTTDQTGKSTIYFTPWQGDKIALYSGSAWTLYSFTERSLALSGTSGSVNYDVFIYDAAGTPTLELSGAWNNSGPGTGARFSSGPYATLLPTQDGVYVKSTNGTSVDATRRYLGTLRTTGTNTTEDSATKRFLWNCYHRVTKPLVAIETADSWTTSTDAWRVATGVTGSNRFEFVRGLDLDLCWATNSTLAFCSGGAQNISAGIGLDNETVNSAQVRGSAGNSGQYTFPLALYDGLPGLGYHYLCRLERSGAGASWYGDQGTTYGQQWGMVGWGFF